MLVVAGGADAALQLIASTEVKHVWVPVQPYASFLQVFNYLTGTGWRQTNPLPGPRSGGKGVVLVGEISTTYRVVFFNCPPP